MASVELVLYSRWMRSSTYRESYVEIEVPVEVHGHKHISDKEKPQEDEDASERHIHGVVKWHAKPDHCIERRQQRCNFWGGQQGSQRMGLVSRIIQINQEVEEPPGEEEGGVNGLNEV